MILYTLIHIHQAEMLQDEGVGNTRSITTSPLGQRRQAKTYSYPLYNPFIVNKDFSKSTKRWMPSWHRCEFARARGLLIDLVQAGEPPR